ncbi:uncharacterized protein LOC118281174 [Spodoptera frugiperda]|uniref:Uncharacterized protein LOC118281174 n=1 Tax=Spodoptera frugiperda TaxID=7108 RepID=A0A9R0F1A4_SPOFR|nr:uncharacterized protein LOC118281174 [Spodoptera frugiperda]
MKDYNVLYCLIILLITLHHTQQRKTRLRTGETIKPINAGEKFNVTQFLNSIMKDAKRIELKRKLKHVKPSENFENNYDLMAGHRRFDDDEDVDELTYGLIDGVELRHPLVED